MSIGREARGKTGRKIRSKETHVEDNNLKDRPYYLPNTQVVCVSSCPTTNDYESFICKYEDQNGADSSVSVLVSFTYLYFIRIPGVLFLTIWSAIVSIGVLLIVGSALLWAQADQWAQDDERSDEEVSDGHVYCIAMVYTVYTW